MQISTISKKILFHSQEIDFSLSEKMRVRSWIASAIHSLGYGLEELNYIFVSDEELLRINTEALAHDYYTDIITFYYHEIDSKRLHSDIYISIDRVKENADKQNISFDTELRRVMIHGTLHLMGYDDHSDEDVIEMRSKEDELLLLF